MKKILMLSLILITAAACNSQGVQEQSADITPTPAVSGEQKGSADLATYVDPKYDFLLKYPSAFELQTPKTDNSDWSNTVQGKGIRVATVYIPQSFEPGTNFGDAKVNVGVSSDKAAVKKCIQNTGLENTSGKIKINGTVFYKYRSEGVGAGNYYQTTSYRAIYMSKCYAVEAVVHSTNIQNYDPSMRIKPFDYNLVNRQLESIVSTFDLE